MTWCVQSLDRDERGRVLVDRWCVLARRVRGNPEYRDNERTACCGMVVTLPCGYADREPTCDGGTA